MNNPDYTDYRVMSYLTRKPGNTHAFVIFEAELSTVYTVVTPMGHHEDDRFLDPDEAAEFARYELCTEEFQIIKEILVN